MNPTHVKKQTGDFGKVFKKTCVGKTKDEIQRWKHALTEVAQIAGFHSSNWFVLFIQSYLLLIVLTYVLLSVLLVNIVSLQ